jgi:para-aminobenzoate synthetase
MSIVIIDNYDSFTYNLFQMVAALTPQAPLVFRNDELTWDQFSALRPTAVIISPGPGRPERPADFGISAEIIRRAVCPILGVCLGQQGICHQQGGRVVHAPEPMHGRIDAVQHDGSELFANIPSPFDVVRYHSLVCAEPLPAGLRCTARTADGLPMALAHATKPIWGVQFHPESIATQHGQQLLRNFLALAGVAQTPPAAPAAEAKPPANSSLRFRRLTLPLDAATIFATLYADAPTSVWLDSARPGQDARFSYLAGGDLKTVSFENQADYFAHLASHLAPAAPHPDLPFAFQGGLIGYLGYEIKALTGGRPAHSSATPPSVFLRVEQFIALDHHTGDIYLVDTRDTGRWLAETEAKLQRPRSPRPHQPEPLHFTARQTRPQYLANIERCLHEIANGETYEVCLTNQLQAETSLDPLAYYFQLRQANPAPYAAFFRTPTLAAACSSPERFLRISATGHVETKPIKGTARRGANPTEDDLLRGFLATDVKSRSENLMIVDLLRNDLGRVCQVGSVTVPKLMHVETYATVHQLVSTVQGQLRPGRSAVDCLEAAFPGGSMTGAPKLRTLEIIDELEPAARGLYSGCLGYLSHTGAADFNIIIRTAVFHQGEVSIGVGGAIVALSAPQEEWDETLLKAQALLQAFGDYTLTTEAAHEHSRSLARSA